MELRDSLTRIVDTDLEDGTSVIECLEGAHLQHYLTGSGMLTGILQEDADKLLTFVGDALGFALVGLPYGFILGFLLGVLNLVPFFGTVVCLPIALSLAYFGVAGSTWRVVGTVLVWGAGQLLDGYFITPKIQGDKTGLGYAGVIFSFFFWGAVFQSLLGLLLAIPLSAFCVVLWRALKSKYIKPVV